MIIFPKIQVAEKSKWQKKCHLDLALNYLKYKVEYNPSGNETVSRGKYSFFAFQEKTLLKSLFSGFCHSARYIYIYIYIYTYITSTYGVSLLTNPSGTILPHCHLDLS